MDKNSFVSVSATNLIYLTIIYYQINVKYTPRQYLQYGTMTTIYSQYRIALRRNIPIDLSGNYVATMWKQGGGATHSVLTQSELTISLASTQL